MEQGFPALPPRVPTPLRRLLRKDSRIHATENGPATLRLLSRAVRASVGIVALALGIALFTFLTSTKPAPERAAGGDGAMAVRSIRLEPVPVARVWDGYGTARAMNAVNVAAEITGVVLDRPDDIEAGRSVSLGQTIVRLDPEDYRQRLEAQTQLAASFQAQLDGLESRETRLAEQLELAEQEVVLARNEYERAADALERGAGNESEVESRLSTLRRAERTAAAIAQQLDAIPSERASLRAQLANQRAQVRLTERDLERTTITAPIDGLIQSIDAEEGELLTPGHVVARVVDLTRIEVPILIPVAAGPSVVVGDRVELRADSAHEAEWEGTVVGIAPEADADSRSMTVFVEVRQDLAGALRERRAANERGEPLLLPGQFVVARVVTGSVRQRLVVPRTAVERDGVMVASDGPDRRARRARVNVLFHVERSFPGLDPVESQWAVLGDDSELAPGDVVITSNLDEVAEGTPVRPTDPEAIAGEARPGATPASRRTGAGGDG